jgi:hypothetical protein
MQYIIKANRDRATQDGVCDEDSYHGRQFRRRFRVPYVMFEQIVELLKWKEMVEHGHEIYLEERKVTQGS